MTLLNNANNHVCALNVWRNVQPVGKYFEKNHASPTAGTVDRHIIPADSVSLLQALDSLDCHSFLTLGTPERFGKYAPAATLKNGQIARSLDHVEFGSEPGVVCIDADTSDPLETVLSRLHEAGDLLGIDLREVAGCVRPSSGSGFRLAGSNEPVTATGWHIYLFVQRTDLIPEFLDRLSTALWALGHGWVFVSKSGAMLPRTYVDLAMKSPCQPVYCTPRWDAARWERLAESTAFAGTAAITTAGTLQAGDRAKAAEAISAAKAACASEAGKARAAHVRALKASGLRVPAEAGTLLPDTVLTFQDGEQAVVLDVLKEPGQYLGRYLHDPFEPERGGQKAVMNDGWIWSFLHGGYRINLRLDGPAVPELAEAIPGPAESGGYDAANRLLDLAESEAAWAQMRERLAGRKFKLRQLRKRPRGLDDARKHTERDSVRLARETIFIRAGQRVIDLTGDPWRAVDEYTSTLADFCAARKHLREPGSDGKPVYSTTALQHSPEWRRYEHMRFLPGIPQSQCGDVFNTYRRPAITPGEALPDWYMRFVEFLLPDEYERHHFHCWVATLVQYPGQRRQPAIIMCTDGGQRVGRTTLINIIIAVVGTAWAGYRCPLAEFLGRGGQATYTDWMAGLLLLTFREVLAEGIGSEAGTLLYERSKTYIDTDLTRERLRVKHLGCVDETLYFTILAASNHPVPFSVDRNDQRWTFLTNPNAKAPQALYDEVYRHRDAANEWQVDEVRAGYMGWTDWRDFDWKKPLSTAAKTLAQEASMTVPQRIIEMIREAIPNGLMSQEMWHKLASAAGEIVLGEGNPAWRTKIWPVVERHWLEQPWLHADRHGNQTARSRTKLNGKTVSLKLLTGFKEPRKILPALRVAHKFAGGGGHVSSLKDRLRAGRDNPQPDHVGEELEMLGSIELLRRCREPVERRALTGAPEPPRYNDEFVTDEWYAWNRDNHPEYPYSLEMFQQWAKGREGTPEG